MSTKSTIKYKGKLDEDVKHPYHFYEECFDREHVYLKMGGVNFEATRNGILVEIPREVWNEIVEVGKLPIIITPVEREVELERRDFDLAEEAKNLKLRKKGSTAHEPTIRYVYSEDLEMSKREFGRCVILSELHEKPDGVAVNEFDFRGVSSKVFYTAIATLSSEYPRGLEMFKDSSKKFRPYSIKIKGEKLHKGVDKIIKEARRKLQVETLDEIFGPEIPSPLEFKKNRKSRRGWIRAVLLCELDESEIVHRKTVENKWNIPDSRKSCIKLSEEFPDEIDYEQEESRLILKFRTPSIEKAIEGARIISKVRYELKGAFKQSSSESENTSKLPQPHLWTAQQIRTIILHEMNNAIINYNKSKKGKKVITIEAILEKYPGMDKEKLEEEWVNIEDDYVGLIIRSEGNVTKLIRTKKINPTLDEDLKEATERMV